MWHVAIFSTILRFSFEILTRMTLYGVLSGTEHVTLLVGTILWSPGQCLAGCSIISSFKVRVKVIYSWKYTSFVAEKLTSHWISICSPTFSIPLAVSWHHVISSCLPSRPEHLKASTWPFSSLPGHMFQKAELQDANSTNRSPHMEELPRRAPGSPEDFLQAR